MINPDKLDEAIAYIEAHPEEWRQTDWFVRGDGGCGTAACLAGTIALLDGWAPADWCPSALHDGEIAGSATKDGVTRSVESIALGVVGLDAVPGDIHPLFDVDNTLDDIKRIRDEIAAGAL